MCLAFFVLILIFRGCVNGLAYHLFLPLSLFLTLVQMPRQIQHEYPYQSIEYIPRFWFGK